MLLLQATVYCLSRVRSLSGQKLRETEIPSETDRDGRRRRRTRDTSESGEGRDGDSGGEEQSEEGEGEEEAHTPK